MRPSLRSVAALLALSSLSAYPSSLRAQAARDVASLTAPASAPWIRDAVIYELNTRTFSKEGTFNAVTAKLPELKALGVSVIWLMPIHPIAELKKKGGVGSPYAVRDYYEVNPSFGTKADLKKLVTTAHANGLKVIIDIVANHTGWDNVMMKTPSYYKRDAKGQVISPYDWTDVAALNYETPALRKYMSDMLVYWAKEFELDGFRCDVAGEVPTDFWESARAAVEKVRPDIIMLAEAHKPDLLVKAFHLDYAWPMHSALNDVLMNGAPATKLRDEWQTEVAQYPKGALHMRFTDNHDETRAISRFGARGAQAASVMMFTLDGVPMLYNGMEVGDNNESGAPQLFEKLDIFWDASRRSDFPALYKGLIAFRAAHPVLRNGSVDWLATSDADRILSYRRKDANEELVVVLNLSNRPFVGTIEASGEYTDVTPRARPGSASTVALPAVSLEAWGYRVYRKGR